MKIERKYLAHYINVTQEGEAVYERLGQDLETFAPEMSAQVETKRNILGESAVVISGYEKSGAVEPYYADTDTGLFARLQTIIDEDLVLEKLRTDVVEVKLWKEKEDKFEAIREEAYIAVSSYGGDTTGYQIPFTLHYTGKKVKGLFDVTTRTFTEA
jgi:hypothetical protein